MKAQCEAHGLVFDVVGSPSPCTRTSSSAADKCGRAASRRVLRKHPPLRQVRRKVRHATTLCRCSTGRARSWTKRRRDGSTSLVMYWDQMNGLDPLQRRHPSARLGRQLLPGGGARTRSAPTARMGEEGLWKNLEKFLKKVIPVAEECGVVHGHSSGRPALSHLRPAPASSPARRTWTASWLWWTAPPTALCLCTGSPGLRQVQRRGRRWCANTAPRAASVSCTSATSKIMDGRQL